MRKLTLSIAAATLATAGVAVAAPGMMAGDGDMTRAQAQAMAAGLPCVGSIHDAAAGVIVPGSTGYLVDQDDIRELAARIVGLLEREDERRAMGEAGRRRILAEFTFDAFARRLTTAIAGARATAAPAALAGVRPHEL